MVRREGGASSYCYCDKRSSTYGSKGVCFVLSGSFRILSSDSSGSDAKTTIAAKHSQTEGYRLFAVDHPVELSALRELSALVENSTDGLQ
jgi:hypothetical protein